MTMTRQSVDVTAADVVSGPTRGLTLGVLSAQVAYIGSAYLDALASGELFTHKSHISAVLDYDSAACRRRRLVAAAVGAFSLVVQIALEWARPLTRRGVRLCCAACSGGGIVTLTIYRETVHPWVHGAAATVAFGACVLLIRLVARLDGCRSIAIRAANALTAAFGLTIALYGGSIVTCELLGYERLRMPSWALCALELTLVVGFGACLTMLVWKRPAPRRAGEALKIS